MKDNEKFNQESNNTEDDNKDNDKTIKTEMQEVQDQEIDTNTKKNKKQKSSLREWTESIILAIVVTLIISIFIFRTSVDGTSMYSALDDGDQLIAARQAYTFSVPKRGDIIVFDSGEKDVKQNPKYYIKRIIAVEGDIIEIKDGYIKVNGNLLDESYLNPGTLTQGNINEIVRDNHVYVLGDNRNFSKDSRSIGQINVEDIKGKVLFRFYPFNEFGMID